MSGKMKAVWISFAMLGSLFLGLVEAQQGEGADSPYFWDSWGKGQVYTLCQLPLQGASKLRTVTAKTPIDTDQDNFLFALPSELLEIILRKLPLGDVLNLRRINPQFDCFICGLNFFVPAFFEDTKVGCNVGMFIKLKDTVCSWMNDPTSQSPDVKYALAHVREIKKALDTPYSASLNPPVSDEYVLLFLAHLSRNVLYDYWMRYARFTGALDFKVYTVPRHWTECEKQTKFTELGVGYLAQCFTIPHLLDTGSYENPWDLINRIRFAQIPFGERHWIRDSVKDPCYLKEWYDYGLFSFMFNDGREMNSYVYDKPLLTHLPLLALTRKVDTLLLSKTSIQRFPKELNALTDLGWLHCPEGLDPDLLLRDMIELPALKLISFEYCNLSEFPEVLWRCPRLEEIYLEGNQIRSIPRDLLTRLPHLKYLHLEENPIEWNEEHLSISRELERRKNQGKQGYITALMEEENSVIYSNPTHPPLYKFSSINNEERRVVPYHKDNPFNSEGWLEIVRRIILERDKNSNGGWKYIKHPW